MRAIVAWSLNFRLLLVGLAAAAIVLGVGQLRGASVDVLPEFQAPSVEIQTEALGLSATEVESLITVPLESDMLVGIPWVASMRSQSVPGLSSIVIVFEPGTDILKARQVVAERMVAINVLPKVGKPPTMLQPVSAASRVAMIGLSSKTLSPIELSVLARWNIRPRLMGVPGVANVAIWGLRERQLQVQVDPAKLQARGVPLLSVIKSTGNALWVSPLTFLQASTPGSGGFIDSANQRLSIRHVLPITTPGQLAQVNIEGTTFTIGDVASVVEDHQPLIGDAITSDGPGLMLVVEKFPEANVLAVTRDVEAALKGLQPGLSGVQFDAPVYRPASYIEQAIDNLTLALLLGCLLVVLVLIFFLFEWRSALISLVAIPLSLLAAGLVLAVQGATINAMVLAGLVIAVGVVVDDAIIDIENIVRRIRQLRREGSSVPLPRVILEASLEVRGAILYATLINVLAVLPIFFLEGVSGAFFRPLVLAYALAVLASMLVALTVTPALGLILLRNAPLERRESPLVRWLQVAYVALLSRVMAHARPALGGVAIIVLAGLIVVPQLGQSFLPTFKQRDFLIHWITQPSTSLPESIRIATRVSAELRAVPGVRNFGAHIGQALLADEVVGVNFGENWISIDPKANYDATLAAVQDVVAGYPGLQRDVQTYLNERIREVLTGAGDAIVVRIYGGDLDVLRAKAEEVRRGMAGVSGIIDLRVALQAEVPEIDVQVDLAAAQRYGIKPGDVRRAASTLMAGEEVGDIFRNGKAFDVVVWSSPATRQSVTSIQDLPIDLPNGGTVRLAEVASVRVAATPNVIRHQGVARYIDVGANVRGRDLGAVVGEVQARLAAVSFPLEYRAELLGEYAERQAAQTRIAGFALAAAIGIFLLLQAAFGSWRLAAVAFLTLPMALVGGVLAAFLGGGVISLGSLVGFFTVLGIAARNGIMLITHYQHLERVEGEPFGPGLILRGARERLAPILMTALATGLALTPLVILGNIPGHEIEQPMAVVILGGLVSSTLLNLLIVPLLYLRFAPRVAGDETEFVLGPMAAPGLSEGM